MTTAQSKDYFVRHFYVFFKVAIESFSKWEAKKYSSVTFT